MAAKKRRCMASIDIDGHTRAFVQVQNGCDHRCTFCIIPFGRGNSRSLPVDDVIGAGAARWSRNGYREIVLTGVDITSYGADLGDAEAGQFGEAAAARNSRSDAAAAVVDRLGGSRRRSDRCARQ